MATTKNRRWLCPYCNNGKMAPSRLRKIDVRRFCLPCSEKGGLLIERISPALSKKKRASVDKAKAKRNRAAATRQKHKEAEALRWIVEGEDLKPVLQKFVRLAAWRTKRANRQPPWTKNGKPASKFDRRGAPDVNLRRSKTNPTQVAGSINGWALDLTIGDQASLVDTKLHLLWLLTNLAYDGTTAHHGKMFLAAAKSVFKVKVPYQHYPVRSVGHYWHEVEKAVHALTP